MSNIARWLVVAPAEKIPSDNIRRLARDNYLVSINKSSYFVKTSTLTYKIKENASISFRNNKVSVKAINQTHLLDAEIKRNSEYGGEGSMIVDMQGIHSFLFARSKVFNDSVARSILVSLKYLAPDTKYLRIGASGSPSSSHHPGGEVLEYSFIQSNGGGASQTQSGHLPTGNSYSRKLPLNNPDNRTLREERALYSHTAFLSANQRRIDLSLILNIEACTEHINVHEVVEMIVRKKNIQAYSIQIGVRAGSTIASAPVIVGRVLKRLPVKKITTLRQASGIASEQTFKLYPHQEAILYGTNYRREYKDWEKFREGKRYEVYGHIHGKLITKKQRENQHNVFHLRQLFINPGSQCQIILTPIRKIVAIEPVVIKGDDLVSKLNLKSVYTKA